MGAALQSVVSCVAQIGHGSFNVSTVSKMHGEFGSNVSGLWTVAGFLAGTNVSVQSDTSDGRNSVAQNFLIQGMNKSVARTE